MFILIAPQAFKGRLTARQAAQRIAEGLTAEQVTLFPVADGGDGTLEVIVRAVNAEIVETEAMDAQGIMRPVFWGYEPATKTAIIETAQVCGWDPAQHDVLTATSYGLGQVIRAALDHGVSAVFIGVGGTGTNDGGAGMLQALGFRLLDKAGKEIGRGGGALAALERIDKSGADPRLEAVAFIMACDVRNPLLGPEGATMVYGAQKGADSAARSQLEKGMAHYAGVLGGGIGSLPFTGAGGGIAAGALSLLNAQLCPGCETILDLVGFDELLIDTDLVITGEGSLDTQTAYGKAPAVVAERAHALGRKVYAVVGKIGDGGQEVGSDLFDGVYTLDGSWPGEVHNLKDDHKDRHKS